MASSTAKKKQATICHDLNPWNEKSFASEALLDIFQAFVDSVDAKEHITEVLDKEQATRAGDGFCAAVSLKDGKLSLEPGKG